MTRCQLAGRFATPVSSRAVATCRSRITCSASSRYKGTLKQVQPWRARWTRPSANTSRRSGARPQLTHRRGSSPPTTTPPNAPRCIWVFCTGTGACQARRFPFWYVVGGCGFKGIPGGSLTWNLAIFSSRSGPRWEHPTNSKSTPRNARTGDRVMTFARTVWSATRP